MSNNEKHGDHTAASEQQGVNCRLLRKMVPPMFALNVAAFLITLFRGFDVKDLIGFTVGFVYMVACYYYLAKTIEKAVETNVKKAKRMMMSCYAARFSGLFILCFIAFQFKIYSVVGVIIPQLYPRIVLSFDALSGKNYFGKD